MLVQLTRAEERARQAERLANQSPDARVQALIAEREALRSAMREAATFLARTLRDGARVPPPLPAVVDVSEIAELVDSLRPPPSEDT